MQLGPWWRGLDFKERCVAGRPFMVLHGKFIYISVINEIDEKSQRKRLVTRECILLKVNH